MVEIKDLKAYVLTTKNNSRLIDEELPNYPASLPDYEVIYGPIAEDGVTVPSWYKENGGIKHPKKQRKIITNGYCCYIGHSNAIINHHNKYPDSPILILEDDVRFEPEFDTYYKAFIKEVPDDWDAIYLGGHPAAKQPYYIEVKPGVLLAGYVHGLECVILSPKLICKLVDYFNDTTFDHFQVDDTLGAWSANKEIKAYTPLFRFAYQLPSYSTILRKNRDYSNNVYFSYMSLNNTIKFNSENDLKTYMSDTNVMNGSTSLKVYVLTTKNNSRLINNLPKDYPSILPKPEIVFGMTPEDVDVPMPAWYRKKKFNVGSWCCARSKLKLFKDHYAKYPDADIMFIEDDAVFNCKFNPMYESFMKDVPDDWGMIFLGGKFCTGMTRVTELAARVRHIVDNECFIVRANVVPKVIEILDLNARHSIEASDQAIASLMNDVITYTPLVRFVGQRAVHSNIRNSFRKSAGSKITNHARYYTDFDGTGKLALFNEALLYFKDYMKLATYYIPVLGGIGNNLFMIAFGRWLRSLGITVKFTDQTKWGPQTREFLDEVTGEELEKGHVKMQFKLIPKEQVLYKLIVTNKLECLFYPELRHFIDLGKVEIKPIIGVNVRRGDFLNKRLKNSRPDFYDLCELRYYHNAAKIAKKLGLPVRIISDELDKIPKEIIDLFDNPELMHGTFKEDFYNLAECKYKFISNSTFAYWAAYAAPDATVFYPKGCRDDIKLDEWTPLELTDMSDDELEKITPKEEKSE